MFIFQFKKIDQLLDAGSNDASEATIKTEKKIKIEGKKKQVQTLVQMEKMVAEQFEKKNQE